MDVFKTTYLSRCADLGIDPLRAITEALRPWTTAPGDGSPRQKSQDASRKLDLTGQSMSVKACTALAAGLADDVVFTHVVLADAFLGDDGVCAKLAAASGTNCPFILTRVIGCILIAGALKTNATIKHLDLRGNSIRADGATAIGQMLKVNSTLKRLGTNYKHMARFDKYSHTFRLLASH